MTERTIPWQTARAAYRIASRYGFDSYAKEVITMLEDAYPLDITRYFTVSQSLLSVDSNRDYFSMANTIPHSPSYRFRCLILYCCAQQRPMQILRGIKGPDNVVEKLHEDDIARCFQARSRLAHRHLGLLKTISGSNPCPTRHSSCAAIRQATVQQMQEQLDEKSLVDPLFTPNRTHLGTNLCSSCTQTVQTAYHKERQSILDDLANIFALEDDATGI